MFYEHVTIVRTIECAMTLIRVLHKVLTWRNPSCSEVGGTFFYELNVEFFAGEGGGTGKF
jgi:hypothetical protein